MALEEFRKMYVNSDLYHHEVPEEEEEVAIEDDEDDDNIWAKCMSRAMKQNTYSQIKLDQNHAAKLDAEIIENTSSTIRIRNTGISEPVLNIFPTVPPINQSLENKKSNHFQVDCQLSLSQTTFVEYYFILLFLLCFATPVLITTSLNVFIHSAVQNTTYEVIISHVYARIMRIIAFGYSYLMLQIQGGNPKLYAEEKKS